MKKLLLAVVVSAAVLGCKPNQKAVEKKVEPVDTTYVQEAPRPGVPDQREMDSIKQWLDDERRRRDSLK